MPNLDPATRARMENDYQTHEGKAPDSWNETYSDNIDDDVWLTGKVYQVCMGVPLNISANPFDPLNPVYTDEPNLDPTEAYDIAANGGWRVECGTNPTYTYNVRVALASKKLRDRNKSPETTFYSNGVQIRKALPPPKYSGR